MRVCYASLPMGVRPDQSGRLINFDHIYFETVKPAVEGAGVTCVRSDELKMGSVIHKAVFSAVLYSDFMLADITTLNANVIYELGIRHAVGRHSILISDASQRLPFDFSYVMTQLYQLTPDGMISPDESRLLREKITKAIKDAEDSISPLSEFFPKLGAALPKTPCVFIGHGRSKLWARLQLIIENDLGLKTVSYESEARANLSIVEILKKMLGQATFAVLLLTGEDETAEGGKRARQNVIHEAGLFQGLLGFEKVVILKQEGVEEFSNIAGLQYISFTGENIEHTFYELKRVFSREGLLV